MHPTMRVHPAMRVHLTTDALSVPMYLRMVILRMVICYSTHMVICYIAHMVIIHSYSYRMVFYSVDVVYCVYMWCTVYVWCNVL